MSWKQSQLIAGALCAGTLWGAAAQAAQMDLETFNNLRRGMPESEVLLRAGEPDRVTAPGGGLIAHHGHAVHLGPRLAYHYLPDASEHDPWLTVVTMTNGRVSALERRKLLSPLPGALPAPDDPGAAPAPDDHSIRRQRASRTLDAAQAYSEVRWRIHERNQQRSSPASPSRPVYRGTDESGAAYFGDVAPTPPPATGANRVPTL